MRFFLLIVCMFNSTSLLSQEITFDYLVQETIIHSASRKRKIGNTRTLYFLLNKEGKRFPIHWIDKKFVLSLVDSNEELIHYFYLYSKNDSFVPVYSNSYKYFKDKKIEVPASGLISDDTYNFIKKSENEYEFKIYKISLKKPSYLLHLETENSEINYPYLFIDGIDEKLEKEMFKEIHNNNCCKAIKKYTVFYEKSKNTVSVSIDIKKVNIVINIPENLKIKKFE